MARRRFNQKTLWNVAVVAVLLMIMLAIGVFIGRTLTMNTPGNTTPTIGPSATPGNDYNVITAASAVPTASAVTIAPSPAANTATPAPSATKAPTATPRPSPTPSPAPVASPSPTPRPTFTPTPSPTPIDPADAPFYESITPLKPGDTLPPVSDENSYDPGNGPVYIDLSHSNMGSAWAYPGDTLGIQLKLYNLGPAIDTTAKVAITLKKMLITSGGQVIWVDYPINQQFDTRITIGDHGSTFKNISYTIPNNIPGLKGTYKIYIKFYLNDQYSAGVVKVLSIM